jgi:flavin reductase (DIM6/NTAB) family NADH-FMN oxidoreductase RutF
MIDATSFRSALGRFASGVVILTARDADRDVAMTVSAFTSLSLSPPLVLVCVGRQASMHDLLTSHPKVGISILSDEQEACSRRFANRHERRGFDDLRCSRSASGVLLLADALAQIDCQVINHFDAGDHTIFVAQVEGVSCLPGQPLVYFGSAYAQLQTARGAGALTAPPM